ncbi:cardiac-enriched FHL2-interacting protein [Anolis sagrei]|uniref:cardiac-enriched FHL2-interacting protein n=1 Tax=Anolis sagrei TaxID=38937 RepID=UPI0035230850
MQENKKQSDGQSDSSSIGSLLDDTDREVCSLTDRAFRSLCVAELEASYTDSDPAVPSNITHQLSSKLLQGPHNEKTVSRKQLSKAEEHSTFQQFPKNSHENKKASTNTRGKMSLPVSGLCNYKHTSKVSSLIKTFDKAEDEASLALAEHPDKNSLKKGPLIFGRNITSLGGKTILNIQKELSEFSDTSQDMANGSDRDELHKRHSKMDLICQGPYSFHFSQADACKSKISNVSKKAVKNRTGRAKEPARKGRFLHSENSAFESWNAHHKNLSEMGDSSEIKPKGHNLTFGGTPFLNESCTSKRNVSPDDITVTGILEQDFSDVLSEKSEASFSSAALPQISLPIHEDTVSKVLLPQVSTLSAVVCKIPTPPSHTSEDPFTPPLTSQIDVLPAPLSKVPISPSLSQISVPPVMVPCGTDAQILAPHVTSVPEKCNNSELENICPPWRKQKLTLGKMEPVQNIACDMPKRKDSLYGKQSDLSLLTESPKSVSIPSSTSFNISKLLTPIIPQERNEVESQLLPVTHPISDTRRIKDIEEGNLYCSQNDYKSKASRLLFNLKDIRKRVKSTYSPSPLPRALEEDEKIKEHNIKSSVTAIGMVQEDSKKLIDDSDKEQMDNTMENSIAADVNENYLTATASKSKADSLNYQNRDNLRQCTSADIEDFKMVSATALHPIKHSFRQYSPSSSCSLDVSEQHVNSLYLQDPKKEKGVPCHSSNVGSPASPNQYFTAEENIVNTDSQACPLNGTEQKGKRSTSSSEQSFISITDQPFNETNSSLLQLFHKACLQESQRKKSDVGVEEMPNCKGTETERRKELHDFLSNDNSNVDGKGKRKKEQSENGSTVQERMGKEKKEDRGKIVDSASESKSEEPLTPILPNSFKPNLFMIKDNTFKSPPVIKTIRLPLHRSFSCQEPIAGSYSETEKQYGPRQMIMNTEEVGLSFSRMRSQHKAEATGKENNPTTEYTHTEGLGSIISLVKDDDNDDDEGAQTTSVLSGKNVKSSENLVREKVRAAELKLSPTSQPNLSIERELAKNKQTSPTREKNHLIPKRRGGSCVKKIISQETKSPSVSESPASFPGLSDTIEDVTAATGSLSNCTQPNPRSASMVSHSFTSPLTGSGAVFNASDAEKITNTSLLHKATESREQPSPTETFNPVQRSQHSEDARNSPVTNGKLQLMGQMAKTAAKPPAVPPKTEKALRRAKKLANKRKKAVSQPKRLQDEPTPPCEDTAHLPLVESPLSPRSLLTPSESNLEHQPAISLSPAPSLPATQRKLLQDPDSGEYFIIDLPVQLKTFYDPESGKYIQLSIPSSKRNLSQTPTSEILSSPHALYPNALPLRVSSVPVLASPSQLSETASSLQGTLLKPTLEWQLADQSPDNQPCDIHDQEDDRSQYNCEKDTSLSANADIISVGAIEDFVVEGIL